VTVTKRSGKLNPFANAQKNRRPRRCLRETASQACTGPRRRATRHLKYFQTLGLLSVSGVMGANKLSRNLAGLPASAHVDVIVQFTHAPSVAELGMVNGLGGRLKKTYSRRSVHAAGSRADRPRRQSEYRLRLTGPECRRGSGIRRSHPECQHCV
jgi:hypothetical protein